MIEKVDNFPLEELYFLESRDFLEKVDKVFLKANDKFKLNSYCLGLSVQKYNNDNLLYLFNGLRGYYDVKTRYLKKPSLMQIKPPLSKKVYYNEYIMKKYRYSDILIYSLNDFNRPTITLVSDSAGNLYYDLPYRLVDYLNRCRYLSVMKDNYKFWKKEHAIDMRYLLLNFKKLRKFRKIKGFFRTKMLSSFVLGYKEPLINIYYFFENKRFDAFRKISSLLNKKGEKIKVLKRTKLRKKLRNRFLKFKFKFFFKKKLRRFQKRYFKLNKYRKARRFFKNYLLRTYLKKKRFFSKKMIKFRKTNLGSYYKNPKILNYFNYRQRNKKFYLILRKSEKRFFFRKVFYVNKKIRKALYGFSLYGKKYKKKKMR